MTAIDVEHLVKRYRGADRNAVDDISFSVPAGQLFCLLGPNGAGKTTTVSILTTVLRQTSGRVRVGGHDLDSDQPGVRREIGVVFQQPALDQNLTAEENLRLHAVLYGLYRWRPLLRWMPASYRTQVRSTAGLLGISDLLGQPVRSLSGGQRPCWLEESAIARSCTSPGCCSWMSRPPALIRRAGATCGCTCAIPAGNSAPPSC